MIPFAPQILGGLLVLNVVTGLGAYGLWEYSQKLNADKAELKVQITNAKEVNTANLATIDKLVEMNVNQQERMAQLRAQNAQAEDYKNTLLETLGEHNLTALAFKKPGLIESRVNNATKKIFDQLESDTATDSN